MGRAGIPRKIAMSISGHRTESVYLGYDIVSQKDLAIAREKLEALHIEQKEISTRKDNQSNPPVAN
jgi:hypothetical protein